jgi:hypothetical protein
MTERIHIPALEGAIAVVEWFGVWPSFHDCEIIGVDLRRHEVSQLKIHAFAFGPPLPNQRYFERVKDALVTFSFLDIVFLELAADDFHCQNVISELAVTKSDASTTIAWNASYGLAGRIEAKHVSVSLVGGNPNR